LIQCKIPPSASAFSSPAETPVLIGDGFTGGSIGISPRVEIQATCNKRSIRLNADGADFKLDRSQSLVIDTQRVVGSVAFSASCVNINARNFIMPVAAVA
jgi:hypothetical protein